MKIELIDRLLPIGTKEDWKFRHKIWKRGLCQLDCLIAGTMLSHVVRKILTRNKDHFERIKNIKVEGY